MLLRLSKSVVALVSDPSKMLYFWGIRAPSGIFEIVATATALVLERGFSDSIFGLAMVYASLVMYDAQKKTNNDDNSILNEILQNESGTVECNSYLGASNDTQKSHRSRHRAHKLFGSSHKAMSRSLLCDPQSKGSISTHRGSMVDLSKLEMAALWRYWRYFTLREAIPNPLKEQLIDVVQRHFISQLTVVYGDTHPPEFTPNTEKPVMTEEQEEMTKKLRSLELDMKNLQGLGGYKSVSYKDLCMFPGVNLLSGFKMPKFDKYDGHGDPVAHLRRYCNQLRGDGEKEELLMAYFEESLSVLASE
ncbi:hypothetical protein T459_15195 [Capsicum annuum]|uniref:Histone deacetylase complex subunit SAP30 Sin3 binding domain-containing protein n=1 Tax=Capsicum annuum TaxID=4072 RepID=A0A2G2ZJL1_CAPAN|nr:hypothetical protein T459_15195 [Capsicum annuum]